MTDESIMPFGKYKGEPMRKVDPEYLLWLWEGANSPMMHSKSGGVAEYIRKNLKTIMAGAPDKIVIHTSTTPPPPRKLSQEIRKCFLCGDDTPGAVKDNPVCLKCYVDPSNVIRIESL